jgi:hypothetical protein
MEETYSPEGTDEGATIYIVARLKALLQKLRGPKYLPGMKIRNRYKDDASADEVLLAYRGPYVGYVAAAVGWVCNESWTTTKGNIVAVGYYWRLAQ